MNWQFWVALVAWILALPGALVISYWASELRSKVPATVAAFFGTIVGAGATWQYASNTSNADGFSTFVSTFCLASLLALIFALIVNLVINIRPTSRRRGAAMHE
jgi:hypothetical protein